MKIGLFGGAFDPPHLGHLNVANTLISQQLVDEVWFVPVFRHPWAKRMHKTTLAPYEDRVKMLELTIAEAVHPEKMKVVHYRDVSFTYLTLVYFSQKFPQHQFHWIMGSEYLPKFADFLAGHPKLLDFPFYIYPREGFAMEPLYEHMTPLPDAAMVTVSSTEIREKIHKHATISEMVTASVAEFIHQHDLYT